MAFVDAFYQLAGVLIATVANDIETFCGLVLHNSSSKRLATVVFNSLLFCVYSRDYKLFLRQPSPKIMDETFLYSAALLSVSYFYRSLIESKFILFRLQ